MNMSMESLYKLVESAGGPVQVDDGRTGTIDRTERDGTVWVWFGELHKPSDAHICEAINLTRLKVIE